MNNRNKISVEEFFANKLVNVKDCLEFFKKPKSQITLMENGLCVLSNPDIVIISSYINTNTYYTEIHIETNHIPTGTIKDIKLPYIPGIELLLNYQPEFQFDEILIYLTNLINWSSLENKLSKKTLHSIQLSDEDEFQNEILMIERVELVNQQNEDETFYNELLRDEYYGVQYYTSPDFQNAEIYNQELKQSV